MNGRFCWSTNTAKNVDYKFVFSSSAVPIIHCSFYLNCLRKNKSKVVENAYSPEREN